MQFSSEFTVPAPPEQVWVALNDPLKLRHCIPGCKELVAVSDGELHLKVQVSVGPIRTTFGGRVLLQDRNPPHGYRVQFSGDGAGSFARGNAQVRLTPQDGCSLLTYEADVAVGGKLAQVGSRLIDSFAKSNIEEFFTAFSQSFAKSQEVVSAVPAKGAAASMALFRRGAAVIFGASAVACAVWLYLTWRMSTHL